MSGSEATLPFGARLDVKIGMLVMNDLVFASTTVTTGSFPVPWGLRKDAA